MKTRVLLWTLLVQGVACSLPAQGAGLPAELEHRPILTDPSLDRQERERQQEERARRQEADRVEIPALRGGRGEDQQLPADDTPFELRAIRFNESRFLEEAELERIASSYVGRPVTFNDLDRFLQAVNQLYVDRQLLTARAVIPPQTLTDGELRVVLVEARLESVEWNQEPERVSRTFFTDRVALEPGETLDTARLMEEIQRLNDTTPGPQLSASLEAGEAFGTTRVRLDPFEPARQNWWLFANNYGSESTGEYQAGVSGQWFSPSGRADRVSVSMVATEGRWYGDLEYRIPVTTDNLELFLGFNRSTLEIINGPYRDLRIEGESQAWRLGLMQPWWLNPNWLLYGRIEAGQSTSETEIEQGFTLSDTELTSLELTGSVQYRQGPWFWRYDQGLEFARSEERLSGIDGDFQIARGNLFLQRQFEPGHRLVVRSSWQYGSDDDLPSALLYQIGGPNSVRGYESGVLTAAHGLDLGVEGYFRLNDSWELFLLMDGGYVDDSDLPENTIFSVGGGIRYQYGNDLVLNAFYATATEEVVPDQDSGRFLFQLVWQL